MPSQVSVLTDRAFYHLTCRGVEQRSIYESEQERRQFLSLLERSLTEYQVVLHAYILMTNHFHLLVQLCPGAQSDIEQLSRAMGLCFIIWLE